jgi:hypothetical protein
VDFSKFEPLSGAQPARVIARHADGVFIAMETDSPQPAIGVWDSATGQAVWTQEGALAFAWNHDGSQIILVESASASDPTSSTDRQQYVFDRRLWPADTSVSRSHFHYCVPWEPWPYDIWLAPRSKLALVRWADQGVTGWEPIILSDAGDIHLAGAGFQIDSEVAVEMSPGISPGGRYAANGYQTKHTLTSHGNQIPLTQGRYEVGFITIIDLYKASFHQITLADAVPAKLHGAASRWTDMPVFTSDEEFMLMLPTGSKRTFRVHEH